VAEQAASSSTPIREIPWSQLWQLPSLLAGLVLFGVGLYLALPEQEQNDFAGALEMTAKAHEMSDLKLAEDNLRGMEPDIQEATPEQQARYHLYWGDQIYLTQEEEGWDRADNHLAIIDHYRKAEELGATLNGVRLQRMGESLVALGREGEALALLERLEGEPARRRYLLLRSMIEQRLARGGPDEITQVTSLLTRFAEEVRHETDQGLRRQQEIWAASLRARALVQADAPLKAIEFLSRKLLQFGDQKASNEDLAPLHVQLARGYQIIGDHAEARLRYQAAQKLLLPDDPLNAQVLVGLGQIDLAESGDVRQALEHFSSAVRNYPGSDAYLDALIGKADCEARLGAHAEAIDHFGQAVATLMNRPPQLREKAEDIAATVLSHYEVNFDRSDFTLALDYLTVLRPLYTGELPPRLLEQFAVCHELLAEQKMAEAESGSTETGGSLSEGARRMAYQEAHIHFTRAAEHYYQHAMAVTIADDDAHGESLWQAAANYDAAHRWGKAIEVYAEFIQGRTSDPRRLEAQKKLGLSYMADGQYDAASELFLAMIEEHPRSPETYAALVPLARCQIAMEQFDDAKRTLMNVVEDHPAITPESTQFRDALIALGKLLYTQGDREEAIERLGTAVERYGNSPEGARLKFMLADAYRQSVDDLEDTLEEPLSQSVRLNLQAERASRLENAQVLFGQVIEDYEQRDDERTGVEALYERNAYFYRADCAYDLGRYEQAIEQYNLAAKKYEQHPASLVALVQIVNAYSELGQTDQARAANLRAIYQLNRIPESAFDDPSLPMRHEHWRDWLRSSTELNLFNTQASAGE